MYHHIVLTNRAIWLFSEKHCSITLPGSDRPPFRYDPTISSGFTLYRSRQSNHLCLSGPRCSNLSGLYTTVFVCNITIAICITIYLTGNVSIKNIDDGSLCKTCASSKVEYQALDRPSLAHDRSHSSSGNLYFKVIFMHFCLIRMFYISFILMQAKGSFHFIRTRKDLNIYLA